MANTQVNITENGTTTLATSGKYCDKNVDVVVNVAGGGDDIPEKALTITGNCSYWNYNGKWDWFVEKYGDRVTTKDISEGEQMFAYSYVKTIPFTINAAQNCDMTNIFYKCTSLKEAPSATFPDTSSAIKLRQIFSGCVRLKSADSFLDAESVSNWTQKTKITGVFDNSLNSLFNNCFSLRNVPEWYKALKFSEESTTYIYPLYSPWFGTFEDCISLDEVTDIPVMALPNAALIGNNGNAFSYFVDNCERLKALVFATQEDGTPYAVNWQTQTIDLSQTVGYAKTSSLITSYNSGITANKEVTDDATYQALKDDPDWFTRNINYSRYNHDSAVETINSLPDTSAYLATAGGTNTIKFTSAAGAKTDGGAINTLTEEEIAVATAKGWTVTLV